MFCRIIPGGTLADAVAAEPISEDRVRFYSAEVILALVHVSCRTCSFCVLSGCILDIISDLSGFAPDAPYGHDLSRS